MKRSVDLFGYCLDQTFIGRKRPPTSSRRRPLAADKIHNMRSWHWPLTTALILALSLTFPAQAQDPGSAAKPSEETEYDTSQHVDESEENYRARMELRDQRYRDTPRMNTTYTPSSGTEIIDGLPLASQQHIKEQLRDMIIESRQWAPGEDLTDYPYEPSPEAQTNTPLRNRERDAWVEQLQKFQDREEAAYANASGGQAGQQGQQSQQSQQNESQPSSQSGENNNSQQASVDNRSYSAGVAEPPPSTAGVSESALGFLRGAQGPGGPLDKGNGQSGTSDQGDQNETTENQDALAENQAGNNGEDPGTDTSGSASEAPLPGTLEIGELAMLQGLNGQPGGTSTTPGQETGDGQESGGRLQTIGSGQQDRPQAGSYGESAAGSPQPGTLEMGQLQNLNQIVLQGGTHSASSASRIGVQTGSTSAAGQGSSQAAEQMAQASVQITNAEQDSQSSTSEPQPQEVAELNREVVIEPGTIDISELELLDGDP